MGSFDVGEQILVGMILVDKILVDMKGTVALCTVGLVLEQGQRLAPSLYR